MQQLIFLKIFKNSIVDNLCNGKKWVGITTEDPAGFSKYLKKEPGSLVMKNIPHLMLNYTFIKTIYEISPESKCDSFIMKILYHCMCFWKLGWTKYTYYNWCRKCKYKILSY